MSKKFFQKLYGSVLRDKLKDTNSRRAESSRRRIAIKPMKGIHALPPERQYEIRSQARKKAWAEADPYTRKLIIGRLAAGNKKLTKATRRRIGKAAVKAMNRVINADPVKVEARIQRALTIFRHRVAMRRWRVLLNPWPFKYSHAVLKNRDGRFSGGNK